MRYLLIRFTYIVQKKKKKNMRKMHKKNKIFSAREHRTQNTRGGVVVPPLSEPTNCPSRARNALWSTRGPTLKKKRTLHYSNATPTVSAVQPVDPAARALSRGGDKADGNASKRTAQHHELPSISATQHKYLKKHNITKTEVIEIAIQSWTQKDPS
jgi:hypothetical protein